MKNWFAHLVWKHPPRLLSFGSNDPFPGIHCKIKSILNTIFSLFSQCSDPKITRLATKTVENHIRWTTDISLNELMVMFTLLGLCNCGAWRFRFYIYFYFPWLIAVFTQNKMTNANCTLASINFEGLVLVSCRGDNIESDTNNVHFPSLENEKRKDAITKNLHYESRASGTNSHL